MRKLSLVLVSFLLAAHVAAERPVCRDLTLRRIEVLALDRLASVLTGALGYRRGLVPFLADDALVLLPGQPIARGQEEALAAFDAFDADGSQRASWQPTRVDASIDGSLGTSWGTLDVTGTDLATHGKNIVVWRRSHGGWRVVAYLQIRSSAVSVPPEGFGLFPDDRVRCAVPVDPTAETEVLKATDDAFAARSVEDNSAVAFRDFAAPDGAIRSGPDVIVGPEAIYESIVPFVDPFEVFDWSASDGAVARSGDLGYTVGLAVDDVRDPGTPEDIGYSKYLTVWQKQPDGNWRYVIDGGNVAPPPSP